MAYQIIQQPNALYMIWSTVSDEPVVLDATRQELIDFFVKECTEDIVYDVDRKIEMIQHGKKPYYQFTLSFDDAMALYKRKHGKQMPTSESGEGEDDA